MYQPYYLLFLWTSNFVIQQWKSTRLSGFDVPFNKVVNFTSTRVFKRCNFTITIYIKLSTSSKIYYLAFCFSQKFVKKVDIVSLKLTEIPFSKLVKSVPPATPGLIFVFQLSKVDNQLWVVIHLQTLLWQYFIHSFCVIYV